MFKQTMATLFGSKSEADKTKRQASRGAEGKYRVDADGNAWLNLENDEVKRAIRKQLTSLKDFKPDRKTA